jgi:hypothetical protein
MHLPALLKKWNYSLTGKIYLSDAVRNFTYEWAWSFLRRLPKGSALCDIGSRDSLFPAFLAWQGFNVDVVEKDGRFIDVQRKNAGRWRVSMGVNGTDFKAFSLPRAYDAACSLFSLQHAGDNDVACHGRAANMLSPGGLFLSACEYVDAGTRFHEGRDDGTMRIYGPPDVRDRIEKPLLLGGMEIVDRRYAGFSRKGAVCSFQEDPRDAAFFFLCARKK